jgi:hypothetical protein
MKLPRTPAILLALAVAACATGGNPQAGRSEALFAGLHPGDSRAAVESLLGPPDNRVRFDLSGNEGWDYKYQDAWGYLAFYSITFSPEGRLLSSISNRINSGGDMH